MAPVAHALAALGGRPTLVLTGQHPRLCLHDFGLGDFEFVQLNCPGEEHPHNHVRKVTDRMCPLLQARPDLLMVQGDTSSALGGALAGFICGVPVAHVEAGLRTHDPQLPWPEEEYRVAIDARADLLFAPTETAAENLRMEEVSGEVHVTGNTGIDSLLAVQAQLSRPPPGTAVRCGCWSRVIAAKVGERAFNQSQKHSLRLRAMVAPRSTLSCIQIRTWRQPCDPGFLGSPASP